MATISGINVRRSQVDRSAESRALLIGAAIEMLHTVGFARATTALIAKKAGMTTGALHHHFATKDELMFGVLDHAAETIQLRFKEREHFSAEGVLDVAGLVNHMWSVYGDPAYWAIWEIIIGTRSDEGLHARVVAHRQASAQARWQPWLDRHVKPGSRAEARAVFEFLFISLRGLSLEKFLHSDSAYFKRNLDILAESVGPRLQALTKPNRLH